jgi:6-phosphogluconolactonase/glucosamine-6-phosphate isomerase/deaminase
MNVKVFDDKASLGKAAAEQAATAIRRAVQYLGRARVIAATGASLYTDVVARSPYGEIPWQNVSRLL